MKYWYGWRSLHWTSMLNMAVLLRSNSSCWSFFSTTYGKSFFSSHYTLLIVVKCSFELWNQIYYLLLSNVKCWDKVLKQLWCPIEFGRFQKFPMQNKTHILSWCFHSVLNHCPASFFFFKKKKRHKHLCLSAFCLMPKVVRMCKCKFTKCQPKPTKLVAFPFQLFASADNGCFVLYNHQTVSAESF